MTHTFPSDFDNPTDQSPPLSGAVKSINMDNQMILMLIEQYKLATKEIINTHHGCREVHWRIDNLEPQQIVDLQHPLGVEWFRTGNCMALHLFSVSEGWHITLLSVPVEIKMQFQFVKQS